MKEGSVAIDINLFVTGKEDKTSMFCLSCDTETMSISLFYFPGPTQDKMEPVLDGLAAKGQWSEAAKQICTEIKSRTGVLDEGYYKHVAQLIRAMVYATP